MQRDDSYTIQKFVFPTDPKHVICKDLFVHSASGYIDRENYTITFGTGQFCDFTTYFNSCSWNKWKKYTNAESLYLQLDIKGAFEACLVGYRFELGEIVRDELGRMKSLSSERRVEEFEYPVNDDMVLGVELTTISDCVFYGGYYRARYNGILNDVDLSVVTTTCNKEEYIIRNIKKIKKELFCDRDVLEHISVHVIDNARTLKGEDIVGDKIFLHPNKNVGGSGGFARGMIESLHQDNPATHVLLMDDDVLVVPESIRRTYALLRLLKDEYKDYFISGAMLRYEKPFMQHEDVGTISHDGIFQPLKPAFDMGFIGSVMKNEMEYKNDNYQYAGWWYCVIPSKTIIREGLPLPLFVRVDDEEYSLRTNAKFITMNGICIWHMSFEMKYSPAMDMYQQLRNMEIAQAVSGILSSVDMHKVNLQMLDIKKKKFEYNEVELIIQAFEDYLKGPEFLMNADGEEILKKNMAYTEKLKRIADSNEVDIPNAWEAYSDYPRKFIDKLFYHFTDNGHRFSPDFVYKKGNMPLVAYGFPIQAQKISRRKSYIAVEPYSECYSIRSMDKKKYKELMNRYKNVEAEYRIHGSEIKEKYKAAKSYLISEEFWRKYLEI